MRNSLSILFLLLFSSAIAQQGKSSYKWSASLTGAILPLPKVNIGIQPGIEYKFNERYALLTEFTIRVGNKNAEDSEVINKQYFRVQEEFRYSLLRGKHKNSRSYIGLRCSYATRKFEDVQGGFYGNKIRSDNGFSYDKAKIISPVITASIQAGGIFRLGKRMGIDAFYGIGARFTDTHYSDLINPIADTRDRTADGPVFYASYSFEGSAVYLHMNAGLRLLWHFME